MQSGMHHARDRGDDDRDRVATRIQRGGCESRTDGEARRRSRSQLAASRAPRPAVRSKQPGERLVVPENIKLSLRAQCWVQ